ncbi:hypothetical protein LTR32_000776 [Rachicladosporium monterosium]|uniref:Uncharacterized protein n=1 Tax=Rachicladosporium monterosium TaxID=1507873 RepID=A0ABR0LF64_9PEZI|nr:hypothetical protein LTR32_000776 [Rachicladosporium monterosium]
MASPAGGRVADVEGVHTGSDRRVETTFPDSIAAVAGPAAEEAEASQHHSPAMAERRGADADTGL